LGHQSALERPREAALVAIPCITGHLPLLDVSCPSMFSLRNLLVVL
jgi:hypothetical protein